MDHLDWDGRDRRSSPSLCLSETTLKAFIKEAVFDALAEDRKQALDATYIAIGKFTMNKIAWAIGLIAVGVVCLLWGKGVIKVQL